MCFCHARVIVIGTRDYLKRHCVNYSVGHGVES